MSWSADMVEVLAQAKAARLPFKFAWAQAIQRHPFIPKELGVTGSEDLLNQSSHEALMWFRTVCENAYEDRPSPSGGPSRLRGLKAALETDMAALSDREQPVRRAAKPQIAA